MNSPPAAADGGNRQWATQEVRPWPVAVDSSSSVGTGPLITVPCLLTGWAFGETGGTSRARAHLLDGDAASGQLLAVIAMTPGGGNTGGPGWPGIACPGGLYLNSVIGTYDGTVWVVPLPGGIG